MATVTSVADGYWDQGGTWDVGVPTIDDDVVIAHTVTIRDENAQCLSVTVNTGKQLVFECANGATKITFKDDATAKIVNNGTITIQNTTSVKKCTWKGGSSTNKVDFQTQGTLNQADYWHWEYLKLSDPANFSTAKKIYIDKDVQTDSVTLNDGATLTVAAGLIWIIGHAGEDAADTLTINSGAHFYVNGASGNKATIRGAGPSNRVNCPIYGTVGCGEIKVSYCDYLYVKNRLIDLTICNKSPSRFDHVTGKADDSYTVYTDTSIVYFDDCSIETGANDYCIIANRTYIKARNTEFKTAHATVWLRAYSTVCDLFGCNVFGKNAVFSPLEGEVNHYSKLTLTVKTGATPLQDAFASLIQDHARDYDAKNQFFGHGSYSKADGTLVIYGLWKVETSGGLVYYSDENNNGPSGTKEKHLLKVVKEGYWPSQNKSYYMSQDRSDTVYLIPLETYEGRVIKFGTFQFPHVEDITEVEPRQFVEKFIPDRNIAYRKGIGGYGRSWRLSGYVDVDIVNTKNTMRGLADDVARAFDLGTGEALVNSIMKIESLVETVTKPQRLLYTVTLMEQSNP